MLPKPEAKASYTQTTMAFINVVFGKAERTQPFLVPPLDSIKQKHSNTTTLLPTSNEPHRQTKLYQVLLSKFPISSYGSERMENMATLMYEMEFFDAKDMVDLTQRDFQRFIEQYIAGLDTAQAKQYKITPGIVNALWQATRPKLNRIQDDVVATDILLPADVRLTPEAYERDPVGSTVTTIQHIISRFHTEARVDIFDLAQAVLGRLSLHDSQDKILTALVNKNVLTPDAVSELRMKERPGRSGLQILEQLILFCCNFTLREVLDKLKQPTGHQSSELRAMIDENKAHREVCVALNHNQELAYFCTFLDIIPANFPEMTKKVNDLMKKAATTPPDKIIADILKEYDHLKLRHKDGYVHTAKRSEVLLKVDSGADMSVTSPGVADPSTVEPKKQRWGWLNNRHAITTEKTGKIRGQVTSIPRREVVDGKKERVVPKRVDFTVPTAVSTDNVEDVMGLEPLIKDPAWHSVTLQLSDDPQKKSYLYGRQNTRVPLERISEKQAGTSVCITTHVSRQSASASMV